MNCANHADASAVAYCRTCGKALCANCTRPVRGVIYCEDCLGARMENSAPPASTRFVPPPILPAGGRVPPPPPVVSSGPNPTVAGILAGFFPFGVGAVYTGQYAKGLAHLAIFGLLVAGCSVENSEALPVICGIGLAFFYVYQIIDAVRSARAIQAGMPAPDPYGLAATFGGGRKIETSRVPLGAIILILLGVLFLLHTMGWGFGFDRFWPLLLIVAGGWMLARNWGMAGGDSAAACQCARCRSVRLMGPAVVLTLGLLFLCSSLGGISFGRTWPILLLVIGGVKLFQTNASAAGHAKLPPPGIPPDDNNTPPAPSRTPSEVSHG
jgi:Domain of unknown function (DUF5668)/B-box zinc finger